MKKIRLNMLLSVATRIIALLTGLIIQNNILLAYGSALNGLQSSITQVMSYLVLLEAGLGLASIQALYEPISRDDWKTISGIMSATGDEYKKITLAFFSLLVVVTVAFPLFVAGEIDFALAAILTFLTGAGYIVSYIFGGKYKALLTADQKIYVVYVVDIATSVLACVLRVLALKVGASITVVQLIFLVCTAAKNIGYALYVKRKYRNIDQNALPQKNLIGKRWNVFIHSIAGMVVNHTDIMILTMFSTLKKVSIYSVYNLIFGQLSALLQGTFLTAPQGTFGKLYFENNKAYRQFYDGYEAFYAVFTFWLTTMTTILALPFVRLYTNGLADANEYLSIWLVFAFSIILLMNQIRIPALLTINSAGAFKETQKGAIVEAVLNIGVSVVLFFTTDLGMLGLLIGTIASYSFRTVDVISYSNKHLIEKNAGDMIRLLVTNIPLLALGVFIFCYVVPLSPTSFLEWFLNAVSLALGWGLAFACCNFAINGKFRSFIKQIFMKFGARIQR